MDDYETTDFEGGTAWCLYDIIRYHSIYSQEKPHSFPMRVNIWGVFCEYKAWFMFWLSHSIAVFNIGLDWFDGVTSVPEFTYMLNDNDT